MVLAIAAIAVLVACSGDAGPAPAGQRAPRGMTLTSTAFGANQPVPERYSCEGDNLPPPLRWTGTPAGTVELALVVEDPDAPDGTFVHWIVVGIDPATTSVGPATALPGARVLRGSSDNDTYIGPCPPDGDGPHRYVFQVYALPERLQVPEGAAPLEAVRVIRQAANAGGSLVGIFER